jgi:hypothetical protein
MCEACDRLTPQQRAETLRSFERAVCEAAGGGEIVHMPAWLSRIERWTIRRGWPRARSAVYWADNALRRVGVIREQDTRPSYSPSDPLFDGMVRDASARVTGRRA